MLKKILFLTAIAAISLFSMTANASETSCEMTVEQAIAYKAVIENHINTLNERAQTIDSGVSVGFGKLIDLNNDGNLELVLCGKIRPGDKYNPFIEVYEFEGVVNKIIHKEFDVYSEPRGYIKTIDNQTYFCVIDDRSSFLTKWYVGTIFDGEWITKIYESQMVYDEDILLLLGHMKKGQKMQKILSYILSCFCKQDVGERNHIICLKKQLGTQLLSTMQMIFFLCWV